MKCIKRVGPSNSRVTKGVTYLLDDDGLIKDNYGQPMKPSWESSDYWRAEDLYTAEASNVSSNHPTQNVQCALDSIDITNSDVFTITNTLTFGQKEEQDMEIKKTTLVNGKDCDMLTIDDFIRMIKQEQKFAEDLEMSTDGVRSTAIDKKIEGHYANARYLAKLLDKVHG